MDVLIPVALIVSVASVLCVFLWATLSRSDSRGHDADRERQEALLRRVVEGQQQTHDAIEALRAEARRTSLDSQGQR